MKNFAIFAFFLSVTLQVPAQATHVRRDGNWWVAQSEDFKLAYIAGFYDGMPLGYHFAYWKFDENDKSTCLGKVVESFATYESKYIASTSNAQLVYNLNSFYSDVRNRRVRTAYAVWIVVNRIAGMPQKDLDRMIESWRDNATD
jgi:hypothetical protein